MGNPRADVYSESEASCGPRAAPSELRGCCWSIRLLGETPPLRVLFGIVRLILRKYKIQINFILLHLETYRR